MTRSITKGSVDQSAIIRILNDDGTPRADVVHLAGPARADHPGDAGVHIERDTDGDDVGCAVRAQGDERAEMTFGPELPQRVTGITQVSHHRCLVVTYPQV